jgi:hypothetical protein
MGMAGPDKGVEWFWRVTGFQGKGGLGGDRAWIYSALHGMLFKRFFWSNMQLLIRQMFF